MVLRGKIISAATALSFAMSLLLFPALSTATEDSSGDPPDDMPDGSRNILENSKVRRFIDEMVTQHDYPREPLRALLAKVRFMPELHDRIRKPAEAFPWNRYRKIFLTPARINGGVQFWRTHKDILTRAEEVHGVPAKVLVAILGVETYFGKRKGKYPVLNSLATLAFQSPTRADFFRSELKQFLLLINEEEGLDAHELKGSYAGAMGLPQFISSSYRRYAVDFDGDGRRDLINSIPDAIGSAAHYLAEHGWQRDSGVAAPARIDKTAITPDLLMKKRGSQPHMTFSALKNQGVTTEASIPDDAKVALIELEMETGSVYWLGQQNFYTITRYNHSNLYAMAVHQLAEAIHARYSQDKKQTLPE